MRPGDWVWLYAAVRGYVYALAEAVTVGPVPGGGGSVTLRWDVPASRALREHPIPRAQLGEFPQSVRRASAGAAEVLNAWLAGHPVGAADPGAGPGDAQRRSWAQILQRRGQPAFRDRLFAAYDGRCAMTGETTDAVLEAAHITPHANNGTMQTSNGLLLRSDLHTLFDRHLIGVDARGRVFVPAGVTAPAYRRRHGQPLLRPRLTRDRPEATDLAAHLSQVMST